MAHDSDHEEIHMPPPSAAPIVVAAGMTFAAVGLIYQVMLFVGIVVLAVGVGMWAFSN